MQYQPEQNIFQMPCSMLPKAEFVEMGLNWSLSQLLKVGGWENVDLQHPLYILWRVGLNIWLHWFQERGTTAHGHRFCRSLISDDSVAKIENGFRKNPRNPLRVASSKLGMPASYEKTIEQAFAALGTETLTKYGKNKNSRINRITRVDADHIEQHNIWKKFISTLITINIGTPKRLGVLFQDHLSKCSNFLHILFIVM